MKMMIMMNMILNMMFLLMKHPMSMGTIIIIQTVIISMMTGMMYKSFWFAYILFLMYIGGMMVLFIYMTSLMPNMMFSLPMKSMFMIMTTLMLMLIFIKNNYFMLNNDMMSITTNKLMLMKMYTSPINIMMILLVMYLLYTMITVFNITDSNKSPLRMTYN